MGVQDARIGVQIARIFSNALFFNIKYPFCFWKGYVSQENSHAKTQRSPQTALQRRTADLSIRQISASTKISVGSIQNILKLAEQHQLSWPLSAALDDQTLALKLYPASDAKPSAKLEQPVCPEVHRELKKKGLTKQLLWEEYSQRFPNRCYSVAGA